MVKFIRLWMDEFRYKVIDGYVYKLGYKRLSLPQ